MKKIFTFFLALVASAGTIFAEKVQIGDLYYILDDENLTATVTCQVDDQSNGGNYVLTEVNIPASVIYNAVTYSVTDIGDGAFHGCTSLTSITIPNSITSIGSGAFGYMIAYCPISEIHYNGTIQEWLEKTWSVKRISSKNYTLYIGDEVLTDLVIPNSVTSIGNNTFYNCTSLTSVTIPNSVTSIGDEAFYMCTGLTSVTIPNSVTSIGNDAFFWCFGLTSIEIPNSVTNIGQSAFNGCSGLTSVTIPNNVTSIGSYAFQSCTGLTSVTIPNSVTSIGSSAFAYCIGLTSVTIPNNVTSIESGAFSYVNNIVYSGSASGSPWGAKSINGYVDGYLVYSDMTKTTLLGCSSAATGNMVIPNSVTSIGSSAFAYCVGLTSVTIPNNVTSIESGAFSYVNNIVYSGSASGSPWGAKSINGYVDGYLVYSDMTKTTLLGCSSAATGNMVIPNSVTSIGNYAFYMCTGLTSITIGNSLTNIGIYAFAGCTGLKSVDIPNSVTSIGGWAFASCTNLQKIYNHGQTPANAYSTSFDGVEKMRCTLYVPQNSINMYQNAAVWRDFYYIEPLETITAIEDVVDSNNGSSEEMTKILRDGKVYILKGDKTYTLQGQEVR